MFERYTEPARRVIFFSRYEASQFGSLSIEIGHLLLGVVREDPNILQRFSPQASIPELRAEVEQRMPTNAKVSTSIDLPLADECRRALAWAAEEAAGLDHRHVGIGHLLLGILRGDHLASEVLRRQGLEVGGVRDLLAASPEPVASDTPAFGQVFYAPGSWVPDAETAVRIAEAVLIPIFGAEEVEKRRPFQAELRRDTWFVRGECEHGKAGVLSAVIRKDGRIGFAGERPG